MKLDKENLEFNQAVDFLENSNRSIFLTGKAGTGKTTFLRHVKDKLKKNIAVVAPTGIAAINAGGVTIHSLFQIAPSVYPPDDIRLRTKASSTDRDKSTIYDHFKYGENRRQLFQSLELLIIDEVSMVRSDLLDAIDKLLKVFSGRNRALPFGGIQVAFIGDPFQLPPVNPGEQWEILSRYYESGFFFSANAYKEHPPIPIELQKIYRQKDEVFIRILNNVRRNRVTQDDLNILNKQVYWEDEIYENEIMLSTHNKSVDEINLKKLDDLPGPLYTYNGFVAGRFPENERATDLVLELKEGAQIIFIKNDTGERRKFYNGKIGKIISLSEHEIEVKCEDGREITLEKATWEKVEYIWDEEEKKIKEKVIGVFTQFPIKLAWAITIHKSQGLTFDRAVIDLENAFAAGQAYVALSRCRTLKGIRLKTKITRHQIRSSKQVARFYEGCEF